MTPPVDAAIALGSNLGDREAILESALVALDGLPDSSLTRVSRWHETDPEGPPGQGPYLNGAVILRTALPARRLLAALLAIERSQGRVREHGLRNGPRTLDLDLLTYGDLICSEPGIEIPHPRFAEREFVLRPLAEIAPELEHPRLRLSVDLLLRRLPRPEPASR